MVLVAGLCGGGGGGDGGGGHYADGGGAHSGEEMAMTMVFKRR